MIQFSGEFCSVHRMFVLEETPEKIEVACAASAEPSARARAERSLRSLGAAKAIEFREMSEHELMLSIAGKIPARKGQPGIRRVELDIRTIESGSPAITLLNSVLLEANSLGASDIHLERGRERTTMRLRIDGILRFARDFDEATGKALSIRIKLLANLNTLEIRRPQDGRFNIVSGGVEHDIRVSIVPCAEGESIVLRFLDTMDSDIRLETLGFTEPALIALKRIPDFTQGLVLVTGPTGSGKTTTLAALIRNCGPEARKIVSIEDPVEYRIPGVTQVQTNEGLGLDFSALLRRILRQDPDVIMIGEIRDAETASLAVRAALTGHLVLSTLHTGTAREALPRLVDMGVPAYLLETVLRLVVAQRLVRRPSARSGVASGLSGRVPVTEFYAPDGVALGLPARTFRDDCALLLGEGKTTRAEISRVFGSAS